MSMRFRTAARPAFERTVGDDLSIRWDVHGCGNRSRNIIVVSLLAGLAAFSAAHAKEILPEAYVVQGTLLLLPSIILPQGEEGEAFEYQPFEYSMRTEEEDARTGGTAVGLVHMSRFARIYLDPPLTEITDANDPSLRALVDHGGVQPDSTFFRLSGTGRIVAVPNAPWPPGEERVIVQPSSRVYFEDAGDGEVLRRELDTMPALGFSVRVTLRDSPDVNNDALNAKLDAPVSVEFEHEHISGICAFLSEYLDVPIAIDPAAVRPAPGRFGPVPSSCVTDGMVPFVTLKEVQLREALRAICRPLELGYELRPGYIWVTARDSLEPPHGRTRPTTAKTAFLDVALAQTTIAERAAVKEAAFLDIGKPMIQTWRGRLELNIPIDTWTLIALDSPDFTGPVGAARSSLEHVLLVRVHPAYKEDLP